MIPAIGYMVALFVFAQFAVWIDKDDDSPLVILYVVGMLGTLFCTVWLTLAVLQADQVVGL